MNFAKRLLSIVMILAVLFAFAGCGGSTAGAEELLKTYFSALNGFNTDAMAKCIVSDNEYKIGFSTETISDGYVQTDNYKKSVESMFKGLSNTFSFTINSTEAVDKTTVKFNVTVKHADVNEEAVNNYVQGKVDNYVTKHPSYFDLNEIEQSDTSIAVMADAYNQYLQITERVTKDIDILVTKVGNNWKIETAKNYQLFSLLTEVFAE